MLKMAIEPEEIEKRRIILDKIGSFNVEKQIETIKEYHFPPFRKCDKSIVIWGFPFNFVIYNEEFDPDSDINKLIYSRLDYNIVVYQENDDGKYQPVINCSKRGQEFIGKRNLYLVRETNPDILQKRDSNRINYEKICSKFTSAKLNLENCQRTVLNIEELIETYRYKLIERKREVAEYQILVDKFRETLSQLENE